MSEFVQLIRELIASGQFGAIIIGLIVVIGGAIWVIWLQRQTVTRFEALLKAIELNMKAADTARNQSKVIQDELREGLQKQFDFVIKTNDELRKELERFRSNQAKFEDDVKKAISIGLDEIKTSLSQVTVTEMVEQIPENFRKDLEKEISQVTDRATNNLIQSLKDAELGKDKDEILYRIIERATKQAVDEILRSGVFHEIFDRMRYEMEREFRRLYEYIHHTHQELHEHVGHRHHFPFR